MTDAFTTVLADDPDAYVEREVSDKNGGPLDMVTSIAIGTGTYAASGSWQGAVYPNPSQGPDATARVLRIPVAGLTAGQHRMYLQIPGGNDLDLGRVYVIARTDR